MAVHRLHIQGGRVMQREIDDTLALDILDKKIEELKERLQQIEPFSDAIEDIQAEMNCYIRQWQWLARYSDD